MGRSHKLTLTDWTTANNALDQFYGGNKSELTKSLKMSRTTVTRFFNQEPIGESSFRKICKVLRLNWEKISSVDDPTPFPSDQPTVQVESDEVSIKQVRERCRQKILSQHSRMRLLSGEEIGVDQLYVDVWLLGKPEKGHLNTPESLLRNFDVAKDRLALGRRIQRNPGLEIANRTSKLIILGKPGSGKTTFLKHLAVDWCKDEFQPNRLAIFIELRKIQDDYWNIWSAIGQESGIENWPHFADTKIQIGNLKSQRENLDPKGENYFNDASTLNKRIKALERQLKDFSLHHFLRRGELLLLIDGFDELATLQLRNSIHNQILEIAKDYPENSLVLTCRTQILEVIPKGFDLVEVADFNSEQVKKFVQNWFSASGYTRVESNKYWEKINHTAISQPELKELTRTPVLLSLMCLILQDEGEIPTNRNWLYKKSIKLLLSRWNTGKQIDTWEVGPEIYRQLNLEDKEAILIEIAARKFENPRNFVLFEQNDLAMQISQKLNLNSLQEGIAVLRAIETQHGLLIERADELWSFSHLTFQEYFTFKWLTQLPHQQLAKKISSQRWKDVVEQLVKSQQPSDRLVRLIKQAIDQSISQESVIQEFLERAFEKSSKTQFSWNSTAVRIMFGSYELTLDSALKLLSDFGFPLEKSESMLTNVRAVDLGVSSD
jgi:predicted NACHT family NTPase